MFLKPHGTLRLACLAPAKSLLDEAFQVFLHTANQVVFVAVAVSAIIGTPSSITLHTLPKWKKAALNVSPCNGKHKRFTQVYNNQKLLTKLLHSETHQPDNTSLTT